MNTRRTIILGALVAWLTLSLAQASALVSYDFGGYDGTQITTKPHKVVSHFKASAITRGAAYASGVKVGLSQNGMAFVPKVEGDATLFFQPYSIESALSHGAYFEITLTPETGYSYSVRSILLGTRRASKRSGPNFFEVRSSLDEFREPLVSAVETLGPGGNESYDILLNFGRSLANLQSAITLRFYGYDRGQSTDQSGIWVITNPVDGLAVVDGDVRKSNN